MSDDYVYVIPQKPGLVPDKATHSAAVAYFRRIAPQASEITASVSDQLEFIHCGGNFGEIRCPGCAEIIELETWQHWMDEDFKGKRKGFVLSRRVLPCCGAKSSLDELNYEWPMGFARFKVSAQNPNLGKLSKTQSRRFEQLLGLAVRIIYEHR